MGIETNNHAPKIPVKSTVVQHKPVTKPAGQDSNKPSNTDLVRQDANAHIQEQTKAIVADAFSRAANPRLAVQTSTTATVAGQVGTSQLQQEEDRKLSKIDPRKAPPKIGQTASTLISAMVDKTLLLANNAGVTFIADLLQKGTDESKKLPLTAQQNRRLLDVKTTTPQSYRAGLERFFASKVAQTLIAKFSGKGMDSEVRLAADMVERFMPSTNV